MATPNKYSFLATQRNQPLVPKGQAVFNADSDYPYNVMTGQPVLFDSRTNTTLEPADLATTTSDYISFAVGVGKKGQLATELRTLTGSLEESLCNFQMKGKGTGPSCAVPQIVDLFFDCVDVDEAYTLQVNLDDALVRSRYQMNEPATYLFSAQTEPAGDCEGCNPERSCEEIVCKLVDQINGNFAPDFNRFARRSSKNRYQPFRASRLFNHPQGIQRFCIPARVSDCGEVTYGNLYQIEVFTGDVVQIMPNPTESYVPLGSIEMFVSKLDKYLAQKGGSATLTTPVGDNSGCGLVIEVSVCEAEVIAFVSGSDDISSCEEFNPFVTVQKDPTCKDCSSTATEQTFTCGIRLLVDSIDVECDCDLPVDILPNYFGRTVSVDFVGDNWNHTHSVVSQEQVLPEGLGLFYQNRARYQHNGGWGRDFRNSDRYVGRTTKRLDDHSRASNIGVDCAETYCVYDLQIEHTNTNFHSNKQVFSNTTWSTLLVPSTDTVTRTAIESVLLELQKKGICNGPVITCA